MFRMNIVLGSCLVLILIFLGLIGCSDNSAVVIPAPFPTDAVVFQDEFGSSVTFQAFAGSKLDALQLEQVETYSGSQGLVITVPDSGDVSGSYAGGAFTADVARDLTGYNAITFWAKASRAVTLNVAGIGNDNTGTSKYTAEVNNLSVTTSWQKYIIPIPLAAKLTSEQGLFYFAEGPENGSGCTIYIDEIIFENLASITNPRPAITTETIEVESGDMFTVGNGSVTFAVDGTDIDVSAMPGYFTYLSSNTSIVSVGTDAQFTASGVGTATLTAQLGSTSATGTITVNVSAPQAVPTTAAPSPTVDPSDVVSLYSDVYNDVTVNLWSTDWDVTELEDITIGTDSVKKYFNLSFAGIEFTNPTVDASAMTYFHIDIWTPNSTDAPAEFKIKLVDFGADGVFGGIDDSEHELSFGHTTLSSETWVGIDVPLISFTNLDGTGHLAQMIISGDLSTVYVDNIYFYNTGVVNAPITPAPTPAVSSDSVISILSDVYTDITVDTWSTVWDNADVEDFAIGTDSLKKYSNLTFGVIEFRTSTIDAISMTHMHLDVWTPDPTGSPSVFKVKLVDFGANGVYDGGGDDVSDEITFDHTTMTTGLWVSIDISLAEFTDLTTNGHIGQLILSGDPNTLFVDNIYFYDSGMPTEPAKPAPTPAYASADVVSLFSDAYTDVTVNTWSASWDSADVADYVIGTDTVKKYTDLLFAGIEFTSNTIDASAMTYFHMDVWTPDPTSAPAIFKIKLVDFGANGTWDDGGGDDVEHELTLDESTMNTGSWVSLDIPLTQFTNLTTRGHVAQLIISGSPNTVFVDNVLFHK